VENLATLTIEEGVIVNAGSWDINLDWGILSPLDTVTWNGNGFSMDGRYGYSIKNCVFNGSAAGGVGSGIAFHLSHCNNSIITNTVIENYWGDSILTGDNCTFTNNTLNARAKIYGDSCTLTNNTGSNEIRGSSDNSAFESNACEISMSDSSNNTFMNSSGSIYVEGDYNTFMNNSGSIYANGDYNTISKTPYQTVAFRWVIRAPTAQSRTTSYLTTLVLSCVVMGLITTQPRTTSYLTAAPASNCVAITIRSRTTPYLTTV
jgi:parallel beta-helix repeat protein